ncbi:hypothetical protein ACFQJC_08615 [Haloferax namakaokahaiae]|uniref:Uncharacterized protein n=1 Tax=Haloferax namakaokahaiae TaxID=1748331 RepID=A0ABD5ZE56_9EURY
MSEDWDVLQILDACRYDMFAKQSPLTGELHSRTSRGSNTMEFLHANFEGRKMHDTVYVTANPQFRRHEDQIDAEFHAVIDVWLDDGWNETYNTVMPETTARYALEAAEKYPEKRILVHYLQPHYPFIDSESTFDKKHLHDESDDTIDFWHEIMFGRLDVRADEVWPLYRKTLDQAFPHVQSVLDRIEGRHVVTADHGNMVGERARPIPIREWGHPEGIHTEELVKVPWLVYNNEDRRSISIDPPREKSTKANSDVVASRLRHLGYTE